jgi:hypothetical protein
MIRSDDRAALTDEVARFQAEVRNLAFAVVRAVVQQELERKRRELERKRPAAHSRKQQELDFKQPAKQPAKRPRGRPRPVKPPPAAPAEAPAPTGATGPTGPTGPTGSTAAEPASEPAAAPPPPAGGPRKRVPWTRESIVNELANWMLSGTAIDATFVTRHGPPGLVAATRRVFGRFDAALNVAALHVSKLYPDGPPER